MDRGCFYILRGTVRIGTGIHTFLLAGRKDLGAAVTAMGCLRIITRARPASLAAWIPHGLRTCGRIR